VWHPKAEFPESLKHASKDEKIDYFDRKFILHHKMIDIVHKTLKLDFVESSEHLIALVTGPTGVGKSRLCQLFLSELYAGYDGVTEDHVVKELPAIYVEAPVHSSSSFAWKDFYLRVLDALYEMGNIKVYGQPRVAGDEKGRVISSRSRTEQDIRKDVERRLQDLSTVYILIDEIQHIFKYGGKTGEKNLDILKSLANITSCRIVGFGTYESSFSIERSAQLARRTKNIEFPSYDANDKESWKNFTSAYMGLLAHVPMQLDKSLGSESEAMFIGSCGCIGILKQWCQRAMTRAINLGDEVLGVQHFKSTRLRASELMIIAEEIKEGRAFFAEPDDDAVFAMLGGVKEETKKVNGGAKKTLKHKPGQRNLGRDRVG
jgi:energy-coupling factor transporter ATP-binding protein EcfA2